MRTKLICCLLLMIAGLMSGQTIAQDPHFSQYASSPMTLNPALIGKGSDGNWRFASIFRTQWWGGGSAPAYNTYTASLEKRFSSSATNSGFAFGISMLSESSNAGLLKNNFLSGGISYRQALDVQGKESLTAGFTVTYGNRFLDASKLYFQSQFGSMGFDRSIPSGDPVTIAGNSYTDINAGIQYSRSNNKMGYSLGAAVFHVGTPTAGASNGNEYSLPSRISLQAGMQFHVGADQLHFSSTADIQSQQSVYTFGAIYKAHINDAPLEFLNIGIWQRFGDSFYPYIAIEDENWLAGITYDVVTSSEKKLYGSVQSLELSLMFKFGKKKSRSAVSGIIFY